jgi:hypothetical protein
MLQCCDATAKPKRTVWICNRSINVRVIRSVKGINTGSCLGDCLPVLDARIESRPTFDLLFWFNQLWVFLHRSLGMCTCRCMVINMNVLSRRLSWGHPQQCELTCNLDLRASLPSDTRLQGPSNRIHPQRLTEMWWVICVAVNTTLQKISGVGWRPIEILTTGN